MYRRYRERRRRRNRPEYRYRTVLTRPAVQIAILLVTALIIFILLQSGAR
jgi:hypothetical protein